jgi:hypothetical protein
MKQIFWSRIVACTLLAALSVAAPVAAAPSGTSEKPAAGYHEIIDRTVSLNAFCKNPKNWIAEDKFAAWNIWQNNLRTDPQAQLKPVNFYGERFSYSLDKKRSHGSDSSLRIRYKVGPQYRDKPHGLPQNDLWSKSYTQQKIPVDLTHYNRFSVWVYVDGLQSLTVPIGLETDFDLMREYYDRQKQTVGRVYQITTRRAIRGGQWTKVWLDFHDTDLEFRKRVRYIVLTYFNMYEQPSDNHDHIDFYWDDFRLEHVANPRQYAGYGADPAVVTVNQLGYKPLAEKIALLPASSAAEIFSLRDSRTHAEVYHGAFRLRRSWMGDFLEGDFSKWERPGTYYVQAGALRSVDFPIADRPYAEAAAATLRVLAGMRCGVATELHQLCHQDSVWDPESGRHLDLVGGYHDAGDVRRFEHNAMVQPKFHMSVRDLLPANDPLREKLLDETKWATTILQKEWKLFGDLVLPVRMQNGRDGNYWTDNRIGTDDDFVLDGTKRTAWAMWIGPALPELAVALRQSDPQFAARTLEIARAMWERSDGWDLRTSLAMWKATGEEKYLEKARAQAAQLLTFQDNRVLERSGAPVSGMIALNSSFSDFVNYPSDRNYGDNIAAYADAMEQIDDDYYPMYFALRRYADFFLKPVTRQAGPYGLPVNLSLGAARDDGAGFGGEPHLLGMVEGRPYYAEYGGSTEAGIKFPYALVRVAGALADPQVEAIAQRTTGEMTGWNPFNFSYINGFGQDSLTHAYSIYPLTKGMIPRNIRFDHLNRTDANELWTVTQAFANTSLAALDAPCQVSGVVARAGQPFHGMVTVTTPAGRQVATFQPDAAGRYGPLLLPGGGNYTLRAGEATRTFAAIAGARYKVDFDVAFEAALRGVRLHGTVARLVQLKGLEAMAAGWSQKLTTDFPVEYSFNGSTIELKAGVPYTLEIEAAALGDTFSRHRLVAHAANATVTPDVTEFEAAPGHPAKIELTVVPRAAGETVCVLLEVDGDHLRKWEMTAVAVPNEAYVAGILRDAEGKPWRGLAQVVNAAGEVVRNVSGNAQDGSFNAFPLIKPGTYTLRSGGRTLATFEAKGGELTHLEVTVK